MFWFRDSREGGLRVEVAFTDAALDLQGNKPGFAEALAATVEATGVPFARLSQVHGDDVVVVTEVPAAGPGEVPHADALVTTLPATGLMIRVADCVPVLLADPTAGVIGAVHAGRPGMALGIIARAVESLRALGARDLTAWVGPHVCGRCYEVPAQMRDEVAARVPASWAETSWGTPALDIGAGVRAQLEADDVTVVDASACTREDTRFPSYRRDGSAAGRMAGLVWMR